MGKYVLESISTGMYDNPLMAIREYIQNSVDAIDALGEHNESRELACIDITIDGRGRSLKIKDTGKGIPSWKAPAVLHDLERLKRSTRRRGDSEG